MVSTLKDDYQQHFTQNKFSEDFCVCKSHDLVIAVLVIVHGPGAVNEVKCDAVCNSQ